LVCINNIYRKIWLNGSLYILIWAIPFLLYLFIFGARREERGGGNSQIGKGNQAEKKKGKKKNKSRI
jgi:hypothetical protein